MSDGARALLQSFLPVHEADRAYVWKFSLQYGGRRPLHFHEEPELNLVVSGSATFRVGTTVIQATRGDLLSFPPGQDHELLETSPDVYIFVLGMTPTLSAQVLSDEARHWALPQRVQLSTPDLTALLARAEAILERRGVEPLAAELWEHAHWLRRKESANCAPSMHVIVRRALALVGEHPDWDSEQVAQQLRANAGEIGRYFHRDIGITLVKYRARVRLMRYIRLVDEGRASMMSAAATAGFGSYSQCHRVFQSELGCQPRQFFQLGFRDQMQQVYVP
jgi:AraC-like DNA-binding protein/quercetin dioxygenase-like cupin family protein